MNNPQCSPEVLSVINPINLLDLNLKFNSTLHSFVDGNDTDKEHNPSGEDQLIKTGSRLTLQQIKTHQEDVTMVSLFETGKGSNKIDSSKENFKFLYAAVFEKFGNFKVVVERNNNPEQSETRIISNEDEFATLLSHTLKLPGSVSGSWVLTYPYNIISLESSQSTNTAIIFDDSGDSKTQIIRLLSDDASGLPHHNID